MSRANPPCPSPFPARLFAGLLGINGLLVVMHLLFSHVWAEYGIVGRLFNLNEEANPPAWYSGALLLLIAISALLIGLQLRQQDNASPWRLYFLGAAGFVFLSMNEVGMIHEALNAIIQNRIGAGSGPFSQNRFIGLITYGSVIALGVALLAWRREDVSAALADRRGRRFLIGGAMTSLLGAVVVDATPNLGFFHYWVEELLEMTGAAMILCGLIARFEPRLEIQIVSGDRGRGRLDLKQVDDSPLATH